MQIEITVENKETLNRKVQSFTLAQVQNGEQLQWLEAMKEKNYDLVSGSDDGITAAVLETLSDTRTGIVPLLSSNSYLKKGTAKGRIPVKQESKKKLVVIHAYVDQLVDNTDGVFDQYGDCWFVVPETWAKKMAKKVGCKNLEEFFSEYTYDYVDDWMYKAIKDGVLRECGIGSISLKKAV